MKKYESFFVAFCMFLSLSLTIAAQQNPIQAENSLTGTTDWQIANASAAVNHEIEGYASQTSVNVGETIRFYLNVNISLSNVSFKIYRLGYYDGAGARLLGSFQARNVPPKEFPVPDSQTGLADCDWSSQSAASWSVPTDAVSGVYLVKLTNRRGFSSYISFVVRDDARASDILFQRSVTTDQAYNNYPGQLNSYADAPENGKSLYESNSFGTLLPGNIDRPHQARKVSFNRPYGVLSNPVTGYGVYQTAGGTLFSYDFQMIRWLEMNGYDVTYCTDVDTHTADATNGRLAAGRHKALLSVGHDEYWSWEMRDNVEQARNRTSQPLNLGFFAGNSCYWQIRFEPSSANNTYQANVPNRTIVGYKENFDIPNASDPFFSDGIPGNNHLITNKWRENQSNQGIISKPPEDELLGVMWSLEPTFCCSSNTAVIAASSPSWITRGTVGQQLDGLVGYEADRIYPENIYNDRVLQIVAASPFVVNGNNLGDSHTTFYTRNGNNARVFAAGTVQWSWGLDNFNADSAIGPVIRDPYRKQDAEIITTNVLGCLINGVCS
jgi:hypothetical protein